MILLHATGNELKYMLMKERLKDFKEIELVNPKMLNIRIDIVEDGKTVEDNSIKKAKAYYEATKLPVIAEDAGLYIDKFKENEQPGMFVKRVNGVDGLSDNEILQYYITKLTEHGGESLANYYTGVCVIDQNGNVYSDTIDESKFLLTAKACDKQGPNGGILESISYDIDCNKYFNERSLEEEAYHYQDLNEKYRLLVKKYILKNEKSSQSL